MTPCSKRKLNSTTPGPTKALLLSSGKHFKSCRQSYGEELRSTLKIPWARQYCRSRLCSAAAAFPPPPCARGIFRRSLQENRIGRETSVTAAFRPTGCTALFWGGASQDDDASGSMLALPGGAEMGDVAGCAALSQSAALPGGAEMGDEAGCAALPGVTFCPVDSALPGGAEVGDEAGCAALTSVAFCPVESALLGGAAMGDGAGCAAPTGVACRHCDSAQVP